MITKGLALLVASILGVSCVSTSTPTTPPSTLTYRKPEAAAKVYKPPGEWPIRSEEDLEIFKTKLGASVVKKNGVWIVDLKGGILDGSKQKGDGGQSEDQTPLLRAYIPLQLRKGFVRNNKNAIVFYKSNSGVDRVTWLTVGEDAVATADNAKNFTVQNCEFINSAKGDKSIQLNEADGAKILNNLVYGGLTGARIGKIDFTDKTDAATCAANKFVNVETAFNVAEMTLEVTEKNTYTGVRSPFKAHDGARIINPDGSVEK